MIEIKNLKKHYNEGKDNECKAVDGIDLVIGDGECVAITGKSGSGKTTLLKMIACLDRPTEGQVIYDGEDIFSLTKTEQADFRNKKTGMIFQDYMLLEDMTCLDNVLLPTAFNKDKAAAKRAEELIGSVGLKEKTVEKVKNFSGGEKQRTAIARALINNPSVIIADEPTGNLDNENRETITDMLLSINKSGKTVIIVTHDADVAAKCRRRIVLADGKIISDTAADKAES